MVWFFERGGEIVKIETRSEPSTGHFVLEITRPDGAHETERYGNPASFQQRLEAIESALQADSWTHSGTEVLPGHWRGPIN